MSALLAATGITHAYGRRTVLDGVSVGVAAGEFVAIIGRNGSGKSTLLRCLGRVLRPDAGTVTLGGRDIFREPPRAYARRVAFVPQAPPAPDDLVVEELVRRGRYPHLGLFGRAGEADSAAIARAIELADLGALAHRALGTLSGGERQRAFIAMALAQTPEVLLLDEPTTFLDIAHQLDLMALVARLARDEGLAVVAVMHDVAQAAFYAQRLVAIRQGIVIADGPAAEVVTSERLAAVFGVALRVVPDPATGAPLVLPG